MADEINLQYTTIKDSLPDFIYEGLREYSSGANAYRPQPAALREKISKKFTIPMEMIFLTAGIDEAIQIFAKAYGKNAYAFTPTYSVYTDVEIFGGKLHRIYSVAHGSYDVPIKAYPDATLIYLANPNNPSGYTSRDDVMKLVKLNPHAIVVIDEAYGAFGDLTVDHEVKKYRHMVVFRSFSKDYGMAGNRIGYVIAHPEVIDKVKNFTTWANVSFLSVGAAITALDNEEYYTKIRHEINVQRDDFISFLKQQKYSVFPSHINAALIQFSSEQTATALVEYLTLNNIVVSHGNGNSNIGLNKSFVRFAIGNRKQMTYVKSLIRKYNKPF